MKEFVAY